MKVLRLIRNYICYCGIEKQEYKEVKKYAYVSNFDVWRILHFLMVAAFGTMAILSFTIPYLSSAKFIYLGGFGYSVLATILFFVLKKESVVGQLLIYLSISVLFLFGAFITLDKPNTPAMAFVAFLLITPVFMIDKPYFMSIELTAASAIFLVWMYFVKDPEVWKIDLVNTIAFTVIGIFVHIIVNSFRIKEFVLIKKINIQKDLDDLTGLKNKSGLTREINEFVTKNTTGKGLFFVLDIDYFKTINDTYGHDVGDNILMELGAILKQKFDNNTIVGRFGGDEFIIFIKNTDEVHVASRVATEIYNEVSEAIKLPNNGEKLTVSMGIAIYHGEEKNYSEIFKKADMALYKTKANRKIKYSIFEEN